MIEGPNKTLSFDANAALPLVLRYLTPPWVSFIGENQYFINEEIFLAWLLIMTWGRSWSDLSCNNVFGRLQHTRQQYYVFKEYL